MEYKGEYYPHLIFDAAVNYLTDKQNKDITIDRKGNMKIANTTLPITYDGDVILNWYGPSGTHTILPLYKVVREINNNKKDFDFKDKIVIVGTTAMSLHDTKSVPIQELQQQTL